MTFGAALTVFTPHNVRGILHQKAEKWLTDSRILKYEAILIHSPELQLKPTTAKNSAEFLYGNCDGAGLVHDCIELIDFQTNIRPDLEEVELTGGEKYFVDGSSRVQEGKRMSGYAIIKGRTMTVLESGFLESKWSAQACELYALYRALKLLEEKSGTIYTDSKYAYGVVHTFGRIWKERGPMSSQGKGLVHKKLVYKVLEALKGPQDIAVVHVKSRQKGTGLHIRGNNLVDQEARRAATCQVL